MLSHHPAEAQQFARALSDLHTAMHRCETCHLDSEHNPCEYCSDPTRNVSLLCVVAGSRDLHAIEASGSYRGKYHVLGGHLDALEGITPEKLNVATLLRRVDTEPISEIILAFNPDIPGEATSMYLARTLMPTGLRISALARGLQTGSDLEYVDPLTLGDALTGRREVK
jgi:recombination protein RecR